jgi:hypothetical protein
VIVGMKMLMLITAILAALEAPQLFAADAAAAPVPNGTTPGRFQVVAANIKQPDGQVTPAVFRVDTATGQIRLYNLVPVRASDGSVAQVFAWSPTLDASVFTK